MQIDPRGLNYVPTLALRASELRGLEKLPGPTKDRLQPLFLLAPWPNANQLSRSMEKLAEAFPSRPYAIDIDRDYQAGSDVLAKFDFAKLKEPKASYANWCDFIADYPNASPVLQHQNCQEADLARQIERFQLLGRTYVVRLELKRLPANLPQIVAALNASGTSDYFIVIEGGWSTDVLQLAGQISGIVRDGLSDLAVDVPIVVSATSMPMKYSDIEGIRIDGFNNRELLKSLRRTHNQRTFVYGDWGSTRPRSYDRASAPLPRIDYPLRDSWAFARSKEETWDYGAAAREIVQLDEWKKNYPMGLWGEEMILGAARGGALAANTVQKNIAARVNIHLHRQAFYDVDNLGQLNLDEPWTDL